MKVLERILWLLVLAGVIAFFLTRPKPGQPEPEIKRDTVTLWDTFYQDKPVPYPVQKLVRDTMYVPAPDSGLVVRSDTVFLPLPIEEVTYTDSLYKAVISGYKPVLEHIEIYAPIKTITITEKEPPKNWTVGVQAGYGVTKSGLSPYVGVGVGYRIF